MKNPHNLLINLLIIDIIKVYYERYIKQALKELSSDEEK